MYACVRSLYSRGFLVCVRNILYVMSYVPKGGQDWVQPTYVLYSIQILPKTVGVGIAWL